MAETILSRSNDLVLAEGVSSLPVATLSTDDLKAEAVFLKLSIEQGKITMREWRIRLGEVLTEVRARLGHGNWLPYVRESLTLQPAQVQNYMLLARNPDTVRNMPPDLSMREELKLLRTPRGPRPVQQPVILEDGSIDVAPLQEPLLRFCLPGMTSAAIHTAIVRTCFPDASTMLDPTYGKGTFYVNGAPLPLRAHDLDPERAPDGVMDVRDLQYDDATFGVVSFDGPHLADGGEDSEMAGRFGTVASQEELDNLIIEGTRECWRVCEKGIIVKVTNHVHDRVFQEEEVLVAEALNWKFTPYEKVYQVRDHAFIDPAWGEQCSAYNNGAVYLIYRKGSQLHVPRRRDEA